MRKRFFYLEQDRTLWDPIRFRDFDSCGPSHVFQKRDASRLRETTLLYLAANTGEVAPDFLQSPVYLFSEKAKKVLEWYEEDLIVKKVVLIHKEREREWVYYQVLMEEREALHETTERYPDGREKKVVLDSKRLGEHQVFLLAHSSIKTPVIGLKTAESLLRRHWIGARMKEIEVV